MLGLVVYLSLHARLPAPVAALIAVVAAAHAGVVSGFIVVKLHVDSFIATLGVGRALTGIVLLLSDNTQLIGQFLTTGPTSGQVISWVLRKWCTCCCSSGW